jgi:tetratricopeptide (TPR) repeat protein
MKKYVWILCLTSMLLPLSARQTAKVTETMQSLKTYPFSDPDPVANPNNRFYPYFRFDGFAAKGVDKQWKVVELENDYIKVTLFPEIGGKVWGAVDKALGKEFIYYNHVVKFRDIAMRGAWVSGGVEFNFGIIGHAPTSATPVDYLTREQSDGSVSYYVSSYEFITRTLWTVEVNLPPDKAYFTTKTTWYNSSSTDQPYYQWMNAGYKADDNIRFCYPGNSYIGHDGELNAFPVDEEGRDISWYKNNAFGESKSFHVLGYYNDFYGAYWHDDDFGSAHYAEYNDKPGMKIFLWALSRSGGIWEDLLTDTDGQYVELQSGRMFNQPASGSAYTPYKHTAFGPQGMDTWTEYWFPAKGTKGLSGVSPIGSLNVLREGGKLKLYFSPLQQINTVVMLYDGDKLLQTFPLQAETLQSWEQTTTQSVPEGRLKVVIGDHLLTYTEVKSEVELNRPKQLPEDFDWNSAYGLYVQGEQLVNQKVWDEAEPFLTASLKKNPYFLPALRTLSSLYCREGRYEEALTHCRTALSLDTYDGEVNFIYGQCNRVLGKITDAKDGFSIASRALSVRSAAYEKLAELYLMEGDFVKAEEYAFKSLAFNTFNLDALQVLMVVYRKTDRQEEALNIIYPLLEELPLYHKARFEEYLLEGTGKAEDFTALVRNELPYETYMELAGWYESINCPEEALTLLSFAGDYPIARYKAAYILHRKGDRQAASAALEKANSLSPENVFPFRPETLDALQWAETAGADWKQKYYQALIYWTNQDKAKAKSLLDACGETDYAPFYLTRAKLKEGYDRLADILKAEQTEMSWRTGFALISHHVASNQWDEAVETGQKYGKRYPDNYYIGLKYAKALCETGQYAACTSLLKKLQVLPNEGAYAGRSVFRQANLFQAMESLDKKNYARVATAIKASREWPENLGVGKPYDYLVDTRIEDYIQAKAYAGQGNKTKEKEQLGKIVGSIPGRSRFVSGNLLSAIALRDLGDKAKADAMVESWSRTSPGNRIAQWCAAIYEGDRAKAAAIAASRYTQADATPWEYSGRDNDFDLLLKLFK